MQLGCLVCVCLSLSVPGTAATPRTIIAACHTTTRAVRYTECRLASAAEDMLLDDLGSNTVDFAPTFDASQVNVSRSVWRGVIASVVGLGPMGYAAVVQL